MMKKKLIYIIILLIILCILIILLWKENNQKPTKEKKVKEEMVVKKIDLETIKANYNDYVKTKDNAKLYVKDDKAYKEISTIHGNIELKLDSNYIVTDEYYKLLNAEVYIHYKTIEKIDNLTPLSGEYKYYKNYIAFNESITLKDNAKLYVDEENYYEVNGGNYPIIIKNDDAYGIEFNNSLVYVPKEDTQEIIEQEESSNDITDKIAVLNYHYTVSSQNENGELNECRQTICITDTKFESHIKYLKENNFYAASLRDLELFIDDKIRLPKNTVVITIDDGWYVSRSITILEKYQMLGTLFLIGSLISPDAYRSEYLEIHSHSWNMHNIGDCPGNGYGGGILCLEENTVLEDLKKSRESLNNTTYFCYPFYEYNKRAIELLKKAGFTMAFAGEVGDSKVRKGQDKFRIPRYVIVNYTSMNQFINYVS